MGGSTTSASLGNLVARIALSLLILLAATKATAQLLSDLEPERPVRIEDARPVSYRAFSGSVDWTYNLRQGNLNDHGPGFSLAYGAVRGLEVGAARLAAAYGIRYLVESDSVRGGTYGAAAAIDLPCILTEAGGVGQLDPAEQAVHSRGLQNVLRALEILPGAPESVEPVTLLRTFQVVTSEHAACWYPAVRAGDTVSQGQPLGELRDYFGDTLAQIAAPLAGVVLYRVTSLAVDPGDPLVGIGAEAGGD